MKIITKNIEHILPYKNNPRDNAAAVELVANSINEFGFKVPLVIDKGGVVVCGHTRLLAAQKLGINELPCVVADDLTEEQIKAFRLADNKVAEKASWNEELLGLELADLTLNMSDFGFDIDTSELDIDESELDDGYYGDERERTFESTNLNDVDLERVTDKWQMPTLEPEYHVPTDLISFNYVLNKDAFEKGVHFYIDDYQFQRMWNNPHAYLARLAKFDCVLTPDFSLYTEMPLPLQIWNVYRSRLIGQIMQDAGIKVIPTLTWSREDSYDFCFDGLPKKSVVSVSTIGVKKGEANKLFIKGMDEAIKRLRPKHIIVYGGDIGYEFPCEVTYINNHNSERFAEFKEDKL